MSTARAATLVLVTAIVVLAAGCGGEQHGTATRQAAPRPSCSAARLRLRVPEQNLPQPVARMRRAIVAAARACDYSRLEELAGKRFTFSYAAERRAGAHWRRRERAGEPVLSILVRLLALRHVGDPSGLYAWPPAYKEHPTEADWQSVRGLYTPKQIALFKKYGSYLGYRVGITARGRWLFFVAGD